MTKSYCVKQRKQTNCLPGSEKIITAKNGRKMIKCVCAECGITKTQFMKSSSKVVVPKTVKELKMPKTSKIVINPWADIQFEKLIGRKKNPIDEFADEFKALKNKPSIREQLTKLIMADLKRGATIKDGKLVDPPKRKMKVPKLPEIIKLRANPKTDKQYKKLMKELERSKITVPKLPEIVKLRANPKTDKQYKKLMKEFEKKPTKKSVLTMTEDEIMNKIEKFMSEEPDAKIMKRINEFMNRFDGKKIGTTLKRNGFEIKKIDNYEYEMSYTTKDFSGKTVSERYLTGTKSSIAKRLYQFEIGISVWYDGRPHDISRLLTPIDYGRKRFPGEKNEFDSFLNNI